MSSESVKILDSNAHEPYTCILTRATNDSGFDIERSHIIPRSIKIQEVGDAYSIHISIILEAIQLRVYEWMLGYDAGTFNIDSHYNVSFRACLSLSLDLNGATVL
jgi:hypothetical protein